MCVGLLPGLKYFFWTREALVPGGVSTPVLKEDFSTGVETPPGTKASRVQKKYFKPGRRPTHTAISCLALTFLNYELTYTAIVIGKGILFF